MRRIRRITPVNLAYVCAVTAILLAVAWAADHLDAPALVSPGGDGRLDINDVYVFQSPANPGNTVMVMTVNPLAGVLSPVVFHPEASYEFKIDNNGDAKEDQTYRVTFGPPGSGMVQDLLLRCTPAAACGPGGAVKARGRTGENIVFESDPGFGIIRAGLFDDPFFFDLNAFLGAYPFCFAPSGPPGSSGNNFFAGLNVSAIVLELPSAVLGSNHIGVWARTELRDVQVDRMGRPAINTVFIPTSFKNAFNAGLPKHDARDFSSFLGSFASLLLPDILTVNTSDPSGFLNGRRLADDVIDIELELIGVSPGSDCVDMNDKEFGGTFPYLAAPH